MSYKRFDQEDVVVSAESVTSPVWSGNQVQLSSFFTSSAQVASTSGNYYMNIYQSSPTSASAEIQCAIAYADQYGSGSLLFNSSVLGKSPSSVVYGQYRSLVLGDEESDFTFGDIKSPYFYVISIERSRYKEKLLPGTLSLKLSNGVNAITLTDNSQQVNTISFADAGRVYELVTGSQGTLSPGKKNTQGYTGNSGSYGKFLPDVGVIIINGQALAAPFVSGGLGLASDRTSNSSTNNIQTFLTSMQSGSEFKLNSEETISSNIIFVRARNTEVNYSTNPSNTTGSGELRHSVMIQSPQAYITTVGLYNDNNDLLAVAKLSRPLVKDFTLECLIRLKLDY